MSAHRPASVFAPAVATPAFAATWWLNGPGTPTSALFAVAIAATLPSLARAWRLAHKPHPAIADRNRQWMRTHLLAHAVPAAFVADRLFAGSTLPVAAWVLALSIFFYSGRRTWSALQVFRPGKMYFVFKRGNTAMLLMTLALTAQSFVIASGAPMLLVERVLALYIGIHAVLVGVAVDRIETDLAP